MHATSRMISIAPATALASSVTRIDSPDLCFICPVSSSRASMLPLPPGSISFKASSVMHARLGLRFRAIGVEPPGQDPGFSMFGSVLLTARRYSLAHLSEQCAASHPICITPTTDFPQSVHSGDLKLSMSYYDVIDEC